MPDIKFGCECGKRLNAPLRAAGKSGTCPACGASVSVPIPGRDPEAQVVESPPAEGQSGDAIRDSTWRIGSRSGSPQPGEICVAPSVAKDTARPGIHGRRVQDGGWARARRGPVGIVDR